MAVARSRSNADERRTWEAAAAQRIALAGSRTKQHLGPQDLPARHRGIHDRKRVRYPRTEKMETARAGRHRRCDRCASRRAAGWNETTLGFSGDPRARRQVSDLNRSDVVVVSDDMEASRSGNVGFQVPGPVVRVWPEEGSVVQAGQPLAQLDTTQYKLQLVMATAAARQAEDQYKRLQQMHQAQGIPPADFVKIETGVEQVGRSRPSCAIISQIPNSSRRSAGRSRDGASR